ncbi:unnamed protein product [Paramecium sonneborni]|uniref:Uncharacterized protein n=1 Tax=Paramecium sonneborni TaxID=65129 RepID=A0A8S1RG08_9CILI|nr:unnamed protein product [Paramecium sonneborni]
MNKIHNCYLLIYNFDHKININCYYIKCNYSIYKENINYYLNSNKVNNPQKQLSNNNYNMEINISNKLGNSIQNNLLNINYKPKLHQLLNNSQNILLHMLNIYSLLMQLITFYYLCWIYKYASFILFIKSISNITTQTMFF